jgi:hypothetical protein
VAEHHQLGDDRGIPACRLRQPAEQSNRAQVQQPNKHRPIFTAADRTTAHAVCDSSGTVQADRENRLRSQFVVLPLTEDAAKGGLFREIDRKAPASIDPKRAGVRRPGRDDLADRVGAVRHGEPCKGLPSVARRRFQRGNAASELVNEAASNLIYCHGLYALLGHLADQAAPSCTEEY